MSAFRIPVHYQLCLDIGTAATVNIPYLIILATKYGVSFQYFLFYYFIVTLFTFYLSFLIKSVLALLIVAETIKTTLKLNSVCMYKSTYYTYKMRMLE